MAGNKSSFPNMGLIPGLIKLGGSGFFFVLLFSACINLLMLTAPLHMLQIYDRVLASMSEMTLVVITGVAIFALAIFGLLHAARDRLLARLGLKIDKKLAEQTFDAMMKSSVRPGGAAQTHALRDVDTIRGFVSSPAISALCDAPWVFLFIGVLYLLHPLFALLGVAGVVWLFFLTIVADVLARRLAREGGAEAIRATYFAEAAARNAEVVSALGILEKVSMRWREYRDVGLVYAAMSANREAPLSGLSKFSRMAIQVGVLSLGAFLVIENQLTAGTMIAGSILVSRALAPVEAAVTGWKALVSAREAWGRLGMGLRGAAVLNQDATSLPKPKGALSVENVSLVPSPGAAPILQNVSFDISPGELLGIVGPSASGKSSLARLLVGAWAPTAGAVRLDGSDVAHWSRSNLGDYVGYLPQDVELFDATVKENIEQFSDGDPNAVFRAAQMACAHDMILQLSNGYDTYVGDSGARLSGGQRQRVALARAIYGNPSFIVLDEPNANLDTAGEEALQAALSALKAAGITVVIVSHRPSVLSVVDKILYLNGGRVEGFGDRKEMIARLSGRPKQKAPTVRAMSEQPRYLKVEERADG